MVRSSTYSHNSTVDGYFSRGGPVFGVFANPRGEESGVGSMGCG